MRGNKLYSLVQPDGTLDLYVEAVDIGAPAPDEVIIRVDAAPIL